MNIYDSDTDACDKPTMIFIHGNSASKRVFDRQIEYYAKDFRVIAFDLLGHGQSIRISDIDNLTATEKEMLAAAFYNPYAMIAEINQLLVAKDIHNAHILGWSLGGHLAYSLVSAHPDLAKSIITIASPPVKFLYTTDNFKQGFYDFFPDLIIPNWISNPQKHSATDLQAYSDYCGYNEAQENDTVLKEEVMHSDPLMRKYLFLESAYNIQALLDGKQFVRTTSIPLLLMCSQDDAGIRSDYIASFDNELIHPYSKVCIMQGAAHAPFITRPEEFYEIVSDFLEMLENTGETL
jgi:pimeloyl-[acyl-carrier protein] methyl ester esterase